MADRRLSVGLTRNSKSKKRKINCSHRKLKHNQISSSNANGTGTSELYDDDLNSTLLGALDLCIPSPTSIPDRPPSIGLLDLLVNTGHDPDWEQQPVWTNLDNLPSCLDHLGLIMPQSKGPMGTTKADNLMSQEEIARAPHDSLEFHESVGAVWTAGDAFSKANRLVLEALKAGECQTHPPSRTSIEGNSIAFPNIGIINSPSLSLDNFPGLFDSFRSYDCPYKNLSSPERIIRSRSVIPTYNSDIPISHFLPLVPFKAVSETPEEEANFPEVGAEFVTLPLDTPPLKHSIELILSAPATNKEVVTSPPPLRRHFPLTKTNIPVTDTPSVPVTDTPSVPVRTTPNKLKQGIELSALTTPVTNISTSNNKPVSQCSGSNKLVTITNTRGTNSADPLNFLRLTRQPRLPLLGPRSYPCDVDGCRWRFATLRQLKIHLGVHRQPSLYMECIIDGCSTRLNSMRNLLVHLHRHFNIPEIPCPHCAQVYRTKSSLNKHLADDHDQVIPCDKCDRKFKRKVELVRHQNLSHTEVRKLDWVCATCGKSMSCRYKLELHMRRHSGERPFQCPQCPLAYMDQGQLNRHTAFTHDNQRLFGCEKCDKRFKQKSHLRDHMQTHEVHRVLLKCPVGQCTRKFKHKLSLNYHLQRH